jgi:phospholipid:diacylglycerol acyltransferase
MVEYEHTPETLDLRGGALTSVIRVNANNVGLTNRADHVDILGATPLNEAILKIAAGRGDLVKDKIESGILGYVEKMQWED